MISVVVQVHRRHMREGGCCEEGTQKKIMLRHMDDTGYSSINDVQAVASLLGGPPRQQSFSSLSTVLNGCQIVRMFGVRLRGPDAATRAGKNKMSRCHITPDEAGGSLSAIYI